MGLGFIAEFPSLFLGVETTENVVILDLAARPCFARNIPLVLVGNAQGPRDVPLVYDNVLCNFIHFRFLSIHPVDSDRDNFRLVHPGLIDQPLKLVRGMGRSPEVDLLFHVYSIANCYTLVNNQFYPVTENQEKDKTE
jgi:hypothetical protein